MTAAPWARVRGLFEAALEAAPADLAAWLEAHEPDDTVRAEVRSLLRHHDAAGTFLDAPAALDPADEDETFAPGTLLGPYTIVRELGRGGMGRVYLATDARLGRSVALKALHPSRAGDTDRALLRREARAAAALTHPGICAVHALEEFDDALVIVTEYIEGETLRAVVARGERLSPASAVDTARQLASALAGAHARDVVHRDLKPENVMRTRDGRLKILDFGLARIAAPAPDAGGPGTLAGAAFGTPAYMAPEQVNGAPGDARSDVFALAALLYEVVTGVHPFAAPTPLATIGRILEAEPVAAADRAPDVPPALSAVMARALRKDPAERFASAGEMLAALESAAAPPVPAGRERARAWWRTHQVAAISLYTIEVLAAWRFKEWEHTALALWAFVALSAVAAIAGVIRGHLLFTERMHPAHVRRERRRTRRELLVVDLTGGALITGLALLVVPARPVPAALAIGLGLAVALAALLIEPSTSAAAFDEPAGT